MNLKKMSVWAFIVSLFSYFLCIVNVVFALATVMPMATELALSHATDSNYVQQQLTGELGGNWMVILTILGWFAIIVGMVALVLSIVVLSKGKGQKFPGKGFAVAALVLSAVYVGLGLLMMLISLVTGGMMMNVSGGGFNV